VIFLYLKLQLRSHDFSRGMFIPYSGPTLGIEEINAVTSVIQSKHVAQEILVEEFEKN